MQAACHERPQTHQHHDHGLLIKRHQEGGIHAGQESNDNCRATNYFGKVSPCACVLVLLTPGVPLRTYMVVFLLVTNNLRPLPGILDRSDAGGTVQFLVEFCAVATFHEIPKPR